MRVGGIESESKKESNSGNESEKENESGNESKSDSESEDNKESLTFAPVKMRVNTEKDSI